MEVSSFFHADTGTWTHVVVEGRDAVLIDPVLDFDARSAVASTRSADALLQWLRERQLTVHWLLETHAHADHISAGAYLKKQLGAALAIGAGIVAVQQQFADVIKLDARELTVFDRLLKDGDELPANAFSVTVIATPGHTADSLCYRIGQHAFIGDTLFAPDVGSARCDFPGGSATQLFASMQKILQLPDDTLLHLCHDYPVNGRAPRSSTTVLEQRRSNIHIGSDRPASDYIALRQTRDAGLAVPVLFWPSIICNLRGGELPAADAQDVRYLNIPLNYFGPH